MLINPWVDDSILKAAISAVVYEAVSNVLVAVADPLVLKLQ
jgi:hypothetical protein